MLKKITDRVYYKEQVNETDRPALGLIVGDICSLVVDAGNSPAHARDFLAEAAETATSPLKYLALTHWHWDHSFGTETMGLTTISHEQTKERLEHLKTLSWSDEAIDARVETGEEIAFCRDMMKKEMPDRSGLTIQSPDITFSERLEIDLGGVTVVLEHIGGDHAPDSVVVFVKEEKVLFLGDCTSVDLYSGDWSYDRDNVESLLARLSTFDADVFLHSHHYPESKEETWTYLELIRNAGEATGDAKMVEEAVSRFKAMYEAAPDEETFELMGYFVSGNKKKEGI
ncbi:MBL fold metallo-hydrolase [Planococcus lenghuensis]|nr:MBL fold metallo-hydrolase [Planococcus lenghuensis]